MERRYQYLTDPVFLAALVLFSINELVLKQFFNHSFLHHHFNDLLLIPCALPILLRLHALLGLREQHLAPTGSEVAGHLAVWCVLFEIAGPHIASHATGDWRDILVYCLGGFVAWLIWHGPVSRSRNLIPNSA